MKPNDFLPVTLDVRYRYAQPNLRTEDEHYPLQMEPLVRQVAEQLGRMRRELKK